MVTKKTTPSIRYRLMPAETKMLTMMQEGMFNKITQLDVLTQMGVDLDGAQRHLRYDYKDAVKWLQGNKVPAGMVGETFVRMVQSAYDYMQDAGVPDIQEMPEVQWVAKEPKFAKSDEIIEDKVDAAIRYKTAYIKEKEAQKRGLGEETTWEMVEAMREKRSEVWAKGQYDALKRWYTSDYYEILDILSKRAEATTSPELLRAMVVDASISYGNFLASVMPNPVLTEDTWVAIVNRQEQAGGTVAHSVENPMREQWAYRWIVDPSTSVHEVVSLMMPITNVDPPRQKLALMARERVMKDVEFHLGYSDPWVAFGVATCVIHEQMTAKDYDELFASLSPEELAGASLEALEVHKEIDQSLIPPGPGRLDDFLRMAHSHRILPVAIMEAWIRRNDPKQTLRWFPMLAYYLVAVIRPKDYNKLSFQVSHFHPDDNKYAKYRKPVTAEDELLDLLISLTTQLHPMFPEVNSIKHYYDKSVMFMQSHDIPEGAIANRMRYELSVAEKILAKPRVSLSSRIAGQEEGEGDEW